MLDSAAAAYALLLGVVAAFNPCGFALLPAYITVIVTGSAESTHPRPGVLRRAVRFGLAMTLGFMLVFTTFGLLFGVVSMSLQGAILPYVSYVTTAIGVVLIYLGVVMALRGELRGPGLRMQFKAPRTALWSQVGYGASFAVASLSCTIGLFLAVVSQALLASNPVGTVLPFVIYGVGMGASVVTVSLLAALVGSTVATSLRRRTSLIMRVGGVLMIFAGLYVVGFGLAEILLQFDVDVLNPLLLTTTRWQASVTDAIQSWGTLVLIGLVVAVAAVIIWLYLRTDRPGEVGADRPSQTETEPTIERRVD